MREKIDREFINKIRTNFGLNEYESKVWISLLMKGVSSVGEIAETSGVPRSRVYDVLESLERKGFVIMKIGKPIKYIAISPSEVIEKMKNNLIIEAKKKAKIFERFKQTEEYKNIESLFNKGISSVKAEDIGVMIKGKFNINSSLKSAIKNAKKKVFIVTNTDTLSEKSKIIKPLLKKLIRAKTKVFIAASGDEKIGKKIARELGVKIRKVDFDARYFIIDGKEVFIILNEGDSAREHLCLHIKSPFFVSSLENLLMPYFK